MTIIICYKVEELAENVHQEVAERAKLLDKQEVAKAEEIFQTVTRLKPIFSWPLLII